MSYFKDKVAVVTGAGGTICSEVARFLGAQGAKVVLIGRTAEKLQAVAGEIPTSLILTADVTDEARMAEVGRTVEETFGPCELLVNGAGGNQMAAMTTNIAYTPAELEADFADRGFFNLDMGTFASVLNTNTLGTVIPSRIFGAQMAKHGGGAILNFASMNTYCPLTRVPAYAMSKAAIANLTQWLAAYLAPANIRVNAVAPGFIVNERSAKFLGTPETGLTPRGKQVIDHTPAGHFGQASDLIGCVEWLLDGEKSAFVSGITVPVDGGFLTRSGV